MYEEIEKIRKDHGLSVEGFCKLIGISKRTYYVYRSTNKKPTGSLLKIFTLINNHPLMVMGLLYRVRNVK